MAEDEVSRSRMLHISDRDLFAAMRLGGPALKAETVCGDVWLMGRMGILSLSRGRVIWAAGVDCREVAYRGKTLMRERERKPLVEL